MVGVRVAGASGVLVTVSKVFVVRISAATVPTFTATMAGSIAASIGSPTLTTFVATIVATNPSSFNASVVVAIVVGISALLERLVREFECREAARDTNNRGPKGTLPGAFPQARRIYFPNYVFWI